MRWILIAGAIAAGVYLALNTRKGRQIAREVVDRAEELKVRSRRMARQKAGEWGGEMGQSAFDRVVGE